MPKARVVYSVAVDYTVALGGRTAIRAYKAEATRVEDDAYAIEAAFTSLDTLLGGQTRLTALGTAQRTKEGDVRSMFDLQHVWDVPASELRKTTLSAYLAALEPTFSGRVATMATEFLAAATGKLGGACTVQFGQTEPWPIEDNGA